MVTARRAASNSGPASPPTSSFRRSDGPGVTRASNTCSSWRPKSSGSTRFTTTADSCTVVSSRTLAANSMVSLTGISSGVHTATRPVVWRSERMSSNQSVWDRMSPTLTRLLMVWGAASRLTMWPEAGASTTTRS